MSVLIPLIFPIMGYLSGSLPFAVWITRYATRTDVRDQGSGHAGTTNTIRKAGLGWGALIFLLDVAKGFLPVYLALHAQESDLSPYSAAFTAAGAVIGHCYPVFAQFRGGMGLATFGGAILAVSWVAFFTGIGLLLALLLITRHRARTSTLTGILFAPTLWTLGMRDVVFWTALVGGVAMAFRFLGDWNRRYHGL
jgi:glycerol-3-phosphate acyltransferase PlsY